MEYKRAELINELDTQLAFAKFINTTNVLISVKCAQFCLDYIQFREQKIKELTEEVAEEKAKCEMCAEVIKRQDKEIASKDAEIKRLRADTIDEFVYMVKEKMREVATGKRTSLIGTGWIDEIAREIKGE